jgi:molecular chaperone GrpE
MSSARDDRGTDERRSAGPVAGADSSSSQAAREEPAPTPPAEGASAQDAQGSDVGGSPSGDELERDIGELLSEAEKQRDEYLELAKRTKADFENYRKRMSAEFAAAGGRGKAELIRDVVPVLDDLERAIAAAGLDPEGDSGDALAHGVLLVFRSLRETLSRNGVESIRPQGERFDPQLHEALSTQPAGDAESGTVTDVIQVGYRLGEQLIRPARVVVAE